MSSKCLSQLPIVSGLLLAFLGGVSCDSKSAHENVLRGGTASQVGAIPAPGTLEQERRLISLSKTEKSVTLIAFRRTEPPPWKDGNTLQFRVDQPAVPGGLEERAIWSVVNIHAENLFEITRRLEIDLIEVQVSHRRQPSEIQETGRPARKIIVDLGYAVITDQRIPKEWLLSEPRCERDIGRLLRAEYPEAFRRN